MMSDIPALKRLERRESDMVLTWANGDEFSIDYRDLRHACPCAKCAPSRNDDESSIILREQVEALAIEKPTVRAVGNYALVFEWNSGCSSGIYRFERLHALCLGQDPDSGKPYVHGAW